MTELQAAKEILSDLFDVRTCEVDEMIRQRIKERTLYGQDFSLSSIVLSLLKGNKEAIYGLLRRLPR